MTAVAFRRLPGVDAPTPADRLEALHRVAEAARVVRRHGAGNPGPQRLAGLTALASALDRLDRIEHALGVRGAP